MQHSGSGAVYMNYATRHFRFESLGCNEQELATHFPAVRYVLTFREGRSGRCNVHTQRAEHNRQIGILNASIVKYPVPNLYIVPGRLR